MQLFRPEALIGQDKLHGEVVLVPQVSWRAIGLFLVATVATAILFLTLGGYSDVATASGRATGDRTVELSVPAATASFVGPGRTLRIAIPGHPGGFDAVVRSAPGTVPVIAELDEAAGSRLRSGMAVEAAVPLGWRSFADRLAERLGR